MQDIVARVLRRDVRAVARLISKLENDEPDATPALAELFGHTGRAYVVGVTGAPGAGKSTLVDGLVRQARAAGQSAAVLAVDPSSPFSGGAILGDRIRMQAHANDAGVFLRSMSARGALGGLARAAGNVVHVLDAAGYDVIFVETVGVGQSELDVAAAADTTLVVVTPGMGDSVQTMKAGILEIADVFALNKADQEGAQRLLRALQEMLHSTPRREWPAPIVETKARDDVGVDVLWAALRDHLTFLKRSGEMERRRARRLTGEVRDLLDHALRTQILSALLDSRESAQILQRVLTRVTDPHSGALQILNAISTHPEHIGSRDSHDAAIEAYSLRGQDDPGRSESAAAPAGTFGAGP